MLQRLPLSILVRISSHLTLLDNISLLSSCSTFHTLIHLPLNLSFSAYKDSAIHLKTSKLHLYIRLEYSQLTPSQLIYLATQGHLDFLRLFPLTTYDTTFKMRAFEAASRRATHTHSKIVLHLLKTGIKPTLGAIQSAFFNAATVGNPDVVEMLLLNGWEPSFDGWTSLETAAQNGSASCLKAILDCSVKVPSDSMERALAKACANGRIKCVKLLLRKKCDDVSLDTAFLKACQKGHFLIVVMMLTDGRVAVDARGYAGLYLALKNRHEEVVRYLYGILKIKSDQAVLWKVACQIGDMEVVNQILLDNSFDPTIQNHLVMRVTDNCVCLRRLLEDRRLDPSVLDNLALRQAKKKGWTQVIRLLVCDERVRGKMDQN